MIKLSIKNLDIWFENTHALKRVTMDIPKHQILTVIGPSNSGKTTFLRACNRLNELNVSLRETGEIFFQGKNIKKIDIEEVRRSIGMVFALPLPLPLSIFENVAYGLRMTGMRNKYKLAAAVEKALQQAYIWDEVKDRLNESAFKLSGGQQQRLCIARTLAVQPEVICFDEPCSGLDPISTAKVEEALIKLKKEYTIILVTNNVKQAARVGDKTAFFLMGELIELDNTDTMFTAPGDTRTDDYISGKFG